MLYCFLNDTAAYKRTEGFAPYVSKNQGALFLDEQMVNYFNTPGVIADPRTTRLTLSVNSTGSGDGVNGIPDGKMTLHLDEDKLGGVDLSTVTNSEWGQLFNIIELVTLTQNKTAATLNAILESDDRFRTIYMTNTVKISGSIATGNRLQAYYLLSNSALLTTKPQVRTWVEFRVELAGQPVDFRVWTEEAAFRNDYPFTTITAILYPCNPSYLLNLTDMANVAKMLQEASLSLVGRIGEDGLHYLGTEVAGDDHTGVYNFLCRYNNSILGIGQYKFTFGVWYKGRVPTREEARAAIKEDITFRTGEDEQTWIDILPDLFSKAAFYLVPMWSNYTTNTSNETIKSGVYDEQAFKRAVAKCFPDYDVDALTNQLEILTCANSDVLIASIPNSDNSAALRQISTIHPSFMGVSNDSPLFLKQDTKARQFCEGLNDTMGILRAAGTGTVADAVVINGRLCLTFTVDGVDYHVVTKRDFPIN